MLFIKFTFLAAVVAGLPSSTNLAARQGCTSPRLRKSWSQATVEERLAYLDAAVCITKKPSRLGMHPNATLHDDFAYTHAMLDFDIHQFAGFLPWHRYFVMVYEKALQDCGYKGTAMYWDWVADSNDPANAAVWDPVTGFGGNGGGTGNTGNFAGPIKDGPFKDFRPLYSGTALEQHGLCRAWSQGNPANDDKDLFGHRYTPQIVAEVLATDSSYDAFREALEGGPHQAVHFGIAIGNGRGRIGDMVPSSSPNDPIFFLHHTQVDRLWWIWQQADESRTNAYDGFHRLPPNAPEGEQGPPVTLNDILAMRDLAPDAKVLDVMDTRNANLCYEYPI
ncbi:hypothetical protein V8F06_012870 [Rhypophila decipiens]